MTWADYYPFGGSLSCFPSFFKAWACLVLMVFIRYETRRDETIDTPLPWYSVVWAYSFNFLLFDSASTLLLWLKGVFMFLYCIVLCLLVLCVGDGGRMGNVSVSAPLFAYGSIRAPRFFCIQRTGTVMHRAPRSFFFSYHSPPLSLSLSLFLRRSCSGLRLFFGVPHRHTW